MSHEEKRLSGERLFQGAIISVEHDQVLLEDGQTALRETVRHPGAVAVLARDGAELLLVRQYRYAVGRSARLPHGRDARSSPATRSARIRQDRIPVFSAAAA